ncbi:hypothetical protein B0H21DRAFT_777700 [Amylocystis lapponica]|nr:hypothetical protein B0H21DRAFT_777700 [Amylocystis lapponica]
MDDDGSLTDTQYIARALDEIDRRFDRPLYNPAEKARQSLAQELGRLPCTIVHSAQPACHATSNRPGVSTLPVYMLVSVRILEGPAGEVTALVRKAVYDALCRTLRHHAAGFGGGRLEHIAEMIMRGLKDQDRSVRLSAGRALVELVRLHQSIGSGVCRRTEPLFTMLYRVFEAENDRWRETTLITVGQIGRIATPDVLGQSVCCLISQLGHENPIVKGTTHMQLQGLARHHKRTTYRLVLPYLDQIAPFLVTRLCTQPTLLVECCRFIIITPSDFIRFTLPRTLPQLFASCDAKVLEAVTVQTGEKPHALFIKESHTILAYALLLPKPGQTNKVLNFVLSILKQAAGDAPIEISSVVRSCIVPLLTELVIAMGEDEPAEAEAAVQALIKVERHTMSSRSRGATPPGNIGAFLKPYMLGIMTALNDYLQEPQGKRPPEFKKKILRSLGPFVTQIGPAVTNVAPQIMATLQTMVVVPELSDVTLQSWLTFLSTLDTRDIGPHVGPTSASFVVYWSAFSHHGRDLARQCLESVIQKGTQLGTYLDEFVSLESIPQLADANKQLMALRRKWKPQDTLQGILERLASESVTVALQALRELKAFLLSDNEKFVRTLASGDVFDPLIGQITSALFTLACRDGESAESLRALAFDCIGALGAVDPDRFEMGISESRMIMLRNFTDENESVTFALHLIRDILVGAFRSTSDITYQNHLAYAIQELLHFCKFTPALVSPEPTGSIPLKVRNRWNGLPKYVLETVTPLLESRFNLNAQESHPIQHPIYLTRQTYREWVQSWTSHLLTRASGEQARKVFYVFSAVVRNKDVGVAHHLLPHLVLNVLLSENQEDAQQIRQELLSVLEDQVDPNSKSSADKKLLSAQTVFTLMDHLNQWVRAIRQDIRTRKNESKRARSLVVENKDEEQLTKIDSILSSVDQGLMAKAALQCRAYARSLMNFERQVVTLRQNKPKSGQLHEYYERLHEIYANLDEPDGMEGVSTLIVSPSLEHQIRQHESTGRWTSAQSCWEVRLQHNPDNLDFHLGLLRCLRNLGHYDTLRTHVTGVLTRNPDWEPQLAGFQVESEWMVGNWGEVQTLVGQTKATTSSILLAHVLLALREGEPTKVADALSNARRLLGAPIVAHGAKGYRRSYDAVLDLHLVHELEVIHDVVTNLPLSPSGHHATLEQLSRRLSSRLDSTLPIFRTREPILSMRRTAFALRHVVKSIISHSWLASAKIARKAGHWQTAYSAMLQAQQCKDPYSFMESAKLIKATGEPLRALQELENSMHLFASTEHDVIDLTEDKDKDRDDIRMKAKLHVLRARWMNDSDRFDLVPVLNTFTEAAAVAQGWESGHFHLGQFQDECYKALSHEDKLNRGTRMNLSTVRSFAKAARYGSKYIYQTIPRLLTLWLDMGEDSRIIKTDVFARVNQEIGSAIKNVPAYKWFTAFPQIVSRVGHSNGDVYALLADLITRVMAQYPKQALWFFASVVKSKSKSKSPSPRAERGMVILNHLREGWRNSRLVNEILRMTEELLALCDYSVREDRKTLSMSKDFQRLYRSVPSPLLIPLQESLTASLPPVSSTSGFTHSESTHEPFPVNAPTFERFHDDIEVMRSLARPRKITIQGSDGQTYMFLGKPKDDLRKDARLMDFNGILNKLLKTNSESRRRQLHIRTYGVVTLNEECGFIQWVPNTIPVRPILMRHYERRNIRSWSPDLTAMFDKIKNAKTVQIVADTFNGEVLPQFPPVFHEWFIETFPEPTAWLASRLAYSRTAAVMSMIGFILGLGDRHCENILLDMNSGDVVHVDFNCLFEKGKTLETPERVPFRLTQNIIDGFGVTGVEGVFRIACEVTMQLLRDNKDCLMSVLDAFVHDPLVEWEDEKRKRRRNGVRREVNLRELAKGALKPIEKKLKGIYTTSRERPEKEISTSNLVQMLIQEATDSVNLGKMYPGWAPWH